GGSAERTKMLHGFRHHLLGQVEVTEAPACHSERVHAEGLRGGQALRARELECALEAVDSRVQVVARDCRRTEKVQCAPLSLRVAPLAGDLDAYGRVLFAER